MKIKPMRLEMPHMNDADSLITSFKDGKFRDAKGLMNWIIFGDNAKKFGSFKSNNYDGNF